MTARPEPDIDQLLYGLDRLLYGDPRDVTPVPASVLADVRAALTWVREVQAARDQYRRWWEHLRDDLTGARAEISGLRAQLSCLGLGLRADPAVPPGTAIFTQGGREVGRITNIVVDGPRSDDCVVDPSTPP